MTAVAPLVAIMVGIASCGSSEKPKAAVDPGLTIASPSTTAVLPGSSTSLAKSPNCLKVETYKFIVYAVDLDPKNTKDNLDTQLVTTGDALAAVAPELRQAINAVNADRLTKLGKPAPPSDTGSQSAADAYNQIDAFYQAQCPVSATGAAPARP